MNTKKPYELLASEKSSVVSFIRYEVGEGIDIQNQDFASEVAAQLRH